jgi:hypothetical protein
MAVFWVVASCSLVKVYQRVRGPCVLIALMMEAARASETMANFYQTTRCYNPEDSHLQVALIHYVVEYQKNNNKLRLYTKLIDAFLQILVPSRPICTQNIFIFFI